MEMYSMDLMSLTKNANEIKDTVLAALEREGLLKVPAAEIADKYVVVLHKEGWLGRSFKRIVGKYEPNALAIDVLKQV